jgi:hypothetical protein
MYVACPPLSLLTNSDEEPTSFTSVGNEADLVMAANVRPLT